MLCVSVPGILQGLEEKVRELLGRRGRPPNLEVLGWVLILPNLEVLGGSTPA